MIGPGLVQGILGLRLDHGTAWLALSALLVDLCERLLNYGRLLPYFTNLPIFHSTVSLNFLLNLNVDLSIVSQLLDAFLVDNGIDDLV